MSTFHTVILDANAIINSGPTSLAGLASVYVTVEEALLEVRDARARQVLAMLPFTINPRLPSESSIEAVRTFARKTGDLARLSRTDLLLLALTHQLEVEANGASHLRTEPLKVPTQAGLHHKRELPACKFFASATGCRNGAACRFKHEERAGVEGGDAALPPGGPVSDTGDAREEAGSTEEAAAPGEGDDAVLAAGLASLALEGGGSADAAPDAVASPLSGAPFSSSAMGAVSGSALRGGLQMASRVGVPVAATDDAAGTPPVAGAAAPAIMPATDVAAFSTHALASVDAVLVPDDDGDGAWITPAPPSARRAAAAASAAAATRPAAAAPARTSVVCVTSDFAMQNVLLQMGLQLASAQGKLVREVKTWVLKCDACFNITDKMDRLFCPTCGNSTLARLGVSIAADGAPSYHYKRHRDFNTRGTVFALPTPQGGRNGGGLLLREDQLLTGKWAQKARERTAPEPMFGDGNAATLGDRPAAPGRAPARATELVVGYGRLNPNATRHRK